VYGRADADDGSGAKGTSVRVAIVGAGFSGLAMALRLKQAGIDDFVVLEREDDLGGVWKVNTYPGCECDIPAHLYSFSFAPNPEWRQTHPKQEDVLRYLRDCAERFGVTPHIRFRHEVREAAWDDERQRWDLKTNRGRFEAQFLVGGFGTQIEPRMPQIKGLESFRGKVFHSARWDHDHDLSGQRVASIGTGSSAIQYVPAVQPQVEQLYVFQRTAAWVMPSNARPIRERERRRYRRFPFLQRLKRRRIYWFRELLVFSNAKNRALTAFLEFGGRRHLKKAVKDPGLRAELAPDFRLGCKRILPSNDWYPALTQPNVELVTQAVEEIRPGSIVTADGAEREVDTIVCGTGFHVADTPYARRVRGKDGRLLSEAWQDGAEAYVGTTVAGFPNLFLMSGPNSSQGHTSMVYMIESQVDYVLDCLRQMQESGLGSVEVRPDVMAAFNEELQARMPKTVWMGGGCTSWYQDANGRVTFQWPDFTFRFRRRTSSFDLSSYATTPANGHEPVVPATAGPASRTSVGV
jgi:cation diffusion facilitator CzcD-associated flavoprotein CzcO